MNGSFHCYKRVSCCPSNIQAISPATDRVDMRHPRHRDLRPPLVQLYAPSMSQPLDREGAQTAQIYAQGAREPAHTQTQALQSLSNNKNCYPAYTKTPDYQRCAETLDSYGRLQRPHPCAP